VGKKGEVRGPGRDVTGYPVRVLKVEPRHPR
jgi:hypothetical protein